ncbi:V-set and immunoglobulin domain-containing protein 10-like isoform X2 [Seriola lalandi dorsalis]|uniref:V-set and immunoglobulin domain-containing protein 10-like isoform X2 n=1 Tax=Seriola lalandi dorsalis TaxID=1841481 RepID=UPI000C6F67A0|nr:V-set and immunoglobulin domain-containing protein 10-like isoform X2 [Seriola lalandi dorsalis]
MTWLDGFGRLRPVFLGILLSFSFQGVCCELVVSSAGPTWVNAIAGSNVTLAVSFSGAPDPAVTWFKGNLPVVTWTIGSSAPPDIANREVLRIEQNGSLTFVNVPLSSSSNYTVEMTKSGLGKAVIKFTLRVFEKIQDVTLSMQPDFVREGTDRFTLQYSILQGVVENQMWLFTGREIKTSSHYLVEQRSVVILKPNRNDTGRYTVSLTNPFNHVQAHMDVTVLYGPDEPALEARPSQSFYVLGESLSLSCRAEGFPQPTAEWEFGGQTLPDSREGVLNLTNVQTSQGGLYTCTLVNEQTNERRQKSMILNIYEKPPGNPICSVQSANGNVDLQYRCRWSGGTPQAQLSFPALSNTSSGAGNFNLTLAASDNLNGKTVTCMAVHPVEQNQCNVTARSPMEFLPTVGTTVDSEGKIVVAIHCVSAASPEAVVSWSKGSEAVASGITYQISSDTTQLKIRNYNVSNFFQQNYTCTCRNPLGTQRRQIQLQGPSISDSSLFPNQEGTIVTLTWEVPPTSVVTGFDIQMKGPDLLSRNRTQTRGTSDKYRTIQWKPGSARSTDVFVLDPNLTYRFRVIPRARMTEGEPSEVHRIGPGEGLSGPAIAGIAAGIPCSLLFLLLLAGLIYLCVYCNKNKSRQTRYPVSRAVEKAITTQSDPAPHNLLTGGLKSPPDYNRLQQTPSERSGALPTFVPPPPVRVATTV